MDAQGRDPFGNAPPIWACRVDGRTWRRHSSRSTALDDRRGEWAAPCCGREQSVHRPVKEWLESCVNEPAWGSLPQLACSGVRPVVASRPAGQAGQGQQHADDADAGLRHLEQAARRRSTARLRRRPSSRPHAAGPRTAKGSKRRRDHGRERGFGEELQSQAGQSCRRGTGVAAGPSTPVPRACRRHRPACQAEVGDLARRRGNARRCAIRVRSGPLRRSAARAAILG